MLILGALLFVLSLLTVIIFERSACSMSFLVRALEVLSRLSLASLQWHHAVTTKLLRFIKQFVSTFDQRF